MQLEGVVETKYVTVGSGDKQKTYPMTLLPASVGFKYFSKIDNPMGLESDEIKELVCISLNMKADKFEKEFAGKMGAIFTIVKEIIEFNYADVFQELDSDEQD